MIITVGGGYRSPGCDKGSIVPPHPQNLTKEPSPCHIENCVIGRNVAIGKGAVLKNCVVLAQAVIGEGVHIENQVIDKWAKITSVKRIVAEADKPGYIRRNDVL